MHKKLCEIYESFCPNVSSGLISKAWARTVQRMKKESRVVQKIVSAIVLHDLVSKNEDSKQIQQIFSACMMDIISSPEGLF